MAENEGSQVQHPTEDLCTPPTDWHNYDTGPDNQYQDNIEDSDDDEQRRLQQSRISAEYPTVQCEYDPLSDNTNEHNLNCDEDSAVEGLIKIGQHSTEADPLHRTPSRKIPSPESPDDKQRRIHDSNKREQLPNIPDYSSPTINSVKRKLSFETIRTHVPIAQYEQSASTSSSMDNRGGGKRHRRVTTERTQPKKKSTPERREDSTSGGSMVIPNSPRQGLGDDKKCQQEEKSEKRYYTAIIHAEEPIKIPKKTQLRLCVAQHPGHAHIVWESTTANNNRVRTAIAKTFNFTSLQYGELITTTQPIRDIRYFIRYLMRYGIRWIYHTGGGISELKLLINQACVDESVNCEDMTDKRIERTNSRAMQITSFLKHKKDAFHYLLELIEKKNIKTYKEWTEKISWDEFETIMTTYGPNVLQTHVKKILEYRKVHEHLKQQDGPWWNYITKEETDNDDIVKQTDYIYNLFNKNSIDICYFLAWYTIIMDKLLNKINTLVLIGESDAGKSMIINRLIHGLQVASITRTGDASQFHLQNVISKRVLTFEEPRITPATVDDFKLLLGGEPMETQIKHQEPEKVDRTPVLITTNKDLGYHLNPSDSTALENRYKLFHFKLIIGKSMLNPSIRITTQAFAAIINANVVDIGAHFQTILCRRNGWTIAKARNKWNTYTATLPIELKEQEDEE